MQRKLVVMILTSLKKWEVRPRPRIAKYWMPIWYLWKTDITVRALPVLVDFKKPIDTQYSLLLHCIVYIFLACFIPLVCVGTERRDIKIKSVFKTNHLPAALGSTWILNIYTSFPWSIKLWPMEDCCCCCCCRFLFLLLTVILTIFDVYFLWSFLEKPRARK